MGLEILYNPASNSGKATLDLVAVHGLGGDPIQTWTHPKTKKCWLKDADFLPRDVPFARVLSFGYNADVVSVSSTASILDHAIALLGSLIDERQSQEETQRPLIFIAHSLGGIIIKQALLKACLEPRYDSIKVTTIGVLFLGTPHQGSNMADYGKVLAKVASWATNRPSSRLLRALQNNSDTLAQLTSDFKNQLSMYQIASFFELKPPRPLSKPVVARHSALLEIKDEDQIPCDTDHEHICKFQAREDEVYTKIWKRIVRMMEKQHPKNTSNATKNMVMRNKFYHVPRSVTSQFTGREELDRQLKETCLPPESSRAQTVQKVFVLYGLGGSGKTQLCLKFAQDHRENFWGVFWVDGSSHQTLERGYEAVGRMCGIEKDIDQIRLWLTECEEPWLLVIDNADDPSLDISRYLPIGNRGTVLITTRNPDCQTHATVGTHEVGRMSDDDATTLLLRTAAIKEPSQSSRQVARSIVETLGFLALAIVQAGAFIRQNMCTLDEYCGEYSRQRQKLLSYRPIQAEREYAFTIYTTWETSISMIEDMASESAEDALFLLQIFSFWHWEGITENIFEDADWWRGPVEQWDPRPFRQAVALLSSFSLISIDQISRHISMHPMVHAWTRDRMVEKDRAEMWTLASHELAMAIAELYDCEEYRSLRSLLPHVDTCVGSNPGDWGPDTEFVIPKAALLYVSFGRWDSIAKLFEIWLDTSRDILGDKSTRVLEMMGVLRHCYNRLGRHSETQELSERIKAMKSSVFGEDAEVSLSEAYFMIESGQSQIAVEMLKQISDKREKDLGAEHPETLSAMEGLSSAYGKCGHWQDALNLRKRVLDVQERLLGEEHSDTLGSMSDVANLYIDSGQLKDAIPYIEQLGEIQRKWPGAATPKSIARTGLLSALYYRLDRMQDSLQLAKQTVIASKEVYGEEHPETLECESNLAWLVEKWSHENETPKWWRFPRFWKGKGRQKPLIDAPAGDTTSNKSS